MSIDVIARGMAGKALQQGGGDSSVTSVNGRKGNVVLSKNDVGLSNVDNTSDLNKPISIATQAEFDVLEEKINSGISGVYRFKGSVDTYTDLEKISEKEVGYVYDVLDTGDNYAWDGSKWDKLSGIVDLSNYYNKQETDELLETKLDKVVDDKYSVLHEGKFTNLFEKTEEDFTEVLTTANYVSERIFAENYGPAYLDKSYNLNSSMWITEFKVRGVVGKELPVGIAETNISDISEVLFTITPTEDNEIPITYKLDGTDSRVTINPDYVDPEKGLINLGVIGDKYFAWSNGQQTVYYRQVTSDLDRVIFTYRNPEGINTTNNSNGNIGITVLTTASDGTYKINDLNDFAKKTELSDLKDRFKGKYISILGDSLTTYAGYIPAGNAVYYPKGDVQSVEDTYWKKLVNYLELNLLKNDSWSSSGIVVERGGRVLSTGRATNLHVGDQDPDIILVNIGTNDFSYGALLGEYDGVSTPPDVADLDTNKFREGYAIMLQLMMERYPKAEIWCCTLINRNYRDDESDKYPEINALGYNLYQFNNAVKEICTGFGVGLIDLYNCGIRHWNLSEYTIDQAHPNKAGMDLYYEQIKGQMLVNTKNTGTVLGTQGALPKNDKYSVIKEGELTDLFEKINSEETETTVRVYNQDELIRTSRVGTGIWTLGPSIVSTDLSVASTQYNDTILPKLQGTYIKTLSFEAEEVGNTQEFYYSDSLSNQAQTLLFTTTTTALGVQSYDIIDGNTNVVINKSSEFYDETMKRIKLPDTGVFYISIRTYSNPNLKFAINATSMGDNRQGFWRTDGDSFDGTSSLGIGLDVIKFESTSYEYKIPEVQELVNPELKTINGESLLATDTDKDIVISESGLRNLNGKKLSLVGDSITTYAGYIPAGYAIYYPRFDVQSVEDMYWMKAIRALGLELLENNSWSGSLVTGTDASAVVGGKRYELLKDGSTMPDIIVINIGTNDFRANVPLGDYIGNTAPDLNTSLFSNAYGYMLSKINELYPNAEVWCCTLATRNTIGSDTFPETNTNGTTIHEYNDAIKKISTAMGCKIVDLANCGITHWNIDVFMGDRLHPNKAGMDLYASQLIGSLSTGLTSTVNVLSSGNENNLPVNSNYSVLHEGVFTDIGEYSASGDFNREPDGGYNTTAISVPSSAPFYFSDREDLVGVKLKTMTYVPKNNRTMTVGTKNFTTFAEAQTLGIGIRTFDEELFTITPLAEDYDKVTTYKLDGTDSRVVINPDLELLDGYIIVDDTKSVGFEAYDSINIGGFGFITGNFANSNNNFICYGDDKGVRTSSSQLSFGFEVERLGTGYIVPVINDLDNKIINKDISINNTIYKEVDGTIALPTIDMEVTFDDGTVVTYKVVANNE